jgi:hypothetical protein
VSLATRAVATVAGSGDLCWGQGLSGGPNLAGTGLAARIGQPRSIAPWNSSDTVVVAATAWPNILLVNTSSFEVRTLAGSGISAFSGDGPALSTGMNAWAVSTNPGAPNAVFFTDTAAYRVRALTPSGSIVTLAGNGSACFADGVGASGTCFSSGLAGVASWVDPATGLVQLYVADRANYRIRLVRLFGGYSGAASATSTACGTGLSAWREGPCATGYGSLSSPQGLALDRPNGGSPSLYITDASRVRVITPGGLLTTLVGSAAGAYANGMGSGGFLSSPRGLAFGPSGVLYVADYGNSRVRALTCGACPAGQFCAPSVDVSNGATLPNVPGFANLACAPGTFGNSTGIGVPGCSGPCASPPGFACGYGSTNASGGPCPSGCACFAARRR